MNRTVFRKIVRRRGWIVCLLLFAGAVAARMPSQSFQGYGVRGGLVIVDDDPWWAVDVGFMAGANYALGFDLGPAGDLHYIPALDLWMGFDDDGNVDRLNFEIQINAGDVKYLFPLPSSVRPYVGTGPMVGVTIYHWDNEYNSNDDTDTDAEFGWNFFAGADFGVSSGSSFFAEIRARIGDFDLFVLKGGLNVGL